MTDYYREWQTFRSHGKRAALFFAIVNRKHFYYYNCEQKLIIIIIHYISRYANISLDSSMYTAPMLIRGRH